LIEPLLIFNILCFSIRLDVPGYQKNSKLGGRLTTTFYSTVLRMSVPLRKALSLLPMMLLSQSMSGTSVLMGLTICSTCSPKYEKPSILILIFWGFSLRNSIFEQRFLSRRKKLFEKKDSPS